uniref:Sperm-specific sodium proton exchanger n=1 Tax=Strongylocentrotus purpuratus TaxID=7668 RepID=UPI0029677B90|nr:Chain A, Sperm-specific sodium proton exchanger [Strongylocentrotus purpuratus]8PCZ_B Chain B, Sperm-specific sodium proton exchanger [Strongylocentrotus purpuratus]8PD3_A Chain A, Sperm-specific sodium proton exchanger [Strongylocentrotus purpuratus]8PD5_A Chain A, Sperm-specific sodium proton exchanger [Strongylocentrotus purpuratus]8PD7_A Chain A, Sperm-specific sodium proton exchanger [Strongylocentrotus purpuratus]8PD8_A Chain A, Sperm-specific sodium proton exchanger [Strongylocentrot
MSKKRVVKLRELVPAVAALAVAVLIQSATGSSGGSGHTPTTQATHADDHDLTTHNGTEEHDDGHDDGHDDLHAHAPKVIVFISGSCLFGAISRSLFKKLPIPYTVVLLILGAILGVVASNVPLVEEHTRDVAHMDPHVLLQIFLPVLIFESAFAMDVHTFMRSFSQVCILALFGLVVASVLTAVLAMNLFNYNWNFSEAMMFGAIMSATDPVAVVALLKDLGASKQLGTIIEGESLLNDGCAIVIFNVFMKMVFFPQLTSTVGQNVLYFLQVAVAGPLWGYAVAKVTVFFLSHIFNDALVEITITLAATYLTYYIGDIWLEVSGVLAVVVLGLIVNAEKTSISPEVEVFLHRFWEMLAYLANTLIFMMVGVVVTQKALVAVDKMDWFYLIILYLAITIIRGMVISLFSPILSRIGYGLTWRNAVIMTWGGLRGAVGLALALVVENLAGNDVIGSKFLFHTAGIVVLTLVINATTIQTLLRILGMSDISIPKRLAMAGAVRRIHEGQNRTLNMLKSDRFLADADWDIATAACEISDPYSALSDDENAPADELTLGERKSVCPGCKAMVPNEPSPREFADMMEEARLRMLKAEKISYWKQFEHGMLAREALRLLVQHAEVAADEKDQFILVDDLKKSWQIKGIYPWLKRKLEDLISEKKIAAIPMPKYKLGKLMYKICHHMAFEVTINIAIVLNIVPIIMEFVVQDKMASVSTMAAPGSTVSSEPSSLQKIEDALRISNYVFFVIYAIEAIVKILGLGRHYIVSHWNKFDAFILVVALVDIIIAETLLKGSITINLSSIKVVKLFRLLRGLRMLRLTKALIPKLILVVNGKINNQLSLGYDVGKGYIIGEEEVGKIIDRMVDNKKILRELKHISETGRLQVVKELGLLQREHPGIAVSVKTRQAIRTILNHSRETIHELQGAGLLDEMEAHKLELTVEIKMKRLMNAPSSIPPPPPENLLKNVSWLAGDMKLIDFIKARASLLHFDYGEVIVREGDESDGLFLIVSGLVKLYGKSAFLDHDNPPVTAGSEENEVFEDYLTVGNVIGEMGVLTKKPRNATVTCETTVQVYFITAEDMNIAIDTFTLYPSLEYRLWRVVAIRIATPLIMEQMAFQGWTQEKVKLHLERGYLVDLAESHFQFNIDATLEDVILINGTAYNAHTREEIRSPCLISRTVHKLTFQYTATEEPRLFVVRNAEYNGPILDGRLDVDSKRSLISITEISSNMCLKHAAELRQKNSKVMLSRKSSGAAAKEEEDCIPNTSDVEQAAGVSPSVPTKTTPKPKSFLPSLGLSMSKERVNGEAVEESPVKTKQGEETPETEEGAAPRVNVALEVLFQ